VEDVHSRIVPTASEPLLITSYTSVRPDSEASSAVASLITGEPFTDAFTSLAIEIRLLAILA